MLSASQTRAHIHQLVERPSVDTHTHTHSRYISFLLADTNGVEVKVKSVRERDDSVFSD